MLPFMISLQEHSNLKAYILSLYLFIIEKKVFDLNKAQAIIWPQIKKFFVFKSMNSQIIYALLFYINYVLEIAQPEEINAIIFPFFLKCITCNHDQTQKLALTRLDSLIPKIQCEENMEALYEKIESLWKKHTEEKVLILSFKFVAKTLLKFSPEIK